VLIYSTKIVKLLPYLDSTIIVRRSTRIVNKFRKRPERLRLYVNTTIGGTYDI